MKYNKITPSTQLEYLQEMIDDMLLKVKTTLPAIVETVHGNGTVDVSLAIQGVTISQNENKETIETVAPAIVLPEMRLCTLSSTKFTIDIPVEVGDEVVVHFSQRNLRDFKETGETLPPSDLSVFKWTDSFVVPMLTSNASLPTGYNSDALVIRNTGLESSIALYKDGKIDIHSPNTVTTTVPTDTVNGNTVVNGNDTVNGNADIIGNLTVGGNTSTSGTSTASQFSGPLIGNVTGNVAGNVTGTASGNPSSNAPKNTLSSPTGSTELAVEGSDNGEALMSLMAQVAKLYVGESDTQGGSLEYSSSSGSGGGDMYLSLSNRFNGNDEWILRTFVQGLDASFRQNLYTHTNKKVYSENNITFSTSSATGTPAGGEGSLHFIYKD